MFNKLLKRKGVWKVILSVYGSLTKAKSDDLVSSDEALFTDDSGLADAAIGVGSLNFLGKKLTEKNYGQNQLLEGTKD